MANYETVIDLMNDRERMKRERDTLVAAITRIDAINDNPAHFNAEINAVCDGILRPHLRADVGGSGT